VDVTGSAVLVASRNLLLTAAKRATNTALPVTSTYGTTAYSNSLNCGQCVGLGNTYCIQKQENTITNTYSTGSSTQTCIAAGTSASQMTDATWSCTNAFADRVYSKFVCQYNTAACGSTSNFTLPTINSTATINITTLALGQTCFYKVMSTCGGPSFIPNDTSKVEVEFVQFIDASLNTSDVVRQYVLGSNDTNKRGSLPATDMPRRDHYFGALLGGNNIANDNQTTYNASTNGTVFGASGRYDKVAGGRKAYGNPTQGNAQLANLTSGSTLDCQNRQLYLAVTATTDQATLNVTLTSLSFYRAPSSSGSSGASFLSMTIAAVIGLISLAFF